MKLITAGICLEITRARSHSDGLASVSNIHGTTARIRRLRLSKLSCSRGLLVQPQQSTV